MKNALAVLTFFVAAAAFGAEPCDLVPSLASALRQHYVFDKVGEKLAAAVESRSSAYRQLSGDKLAAALTEDLRSAANDKHLLVRQVPAPQQTGAGAPPDPDRARRANYGFQRVEILPGNIGYLDLRGFERRGAAADAKAAAAFALLGDAEAVIIDLRSNGGGNPDTVALLSSYLLDRPTLLAEMHHREAAAEPLISPDRPPVALRPNVPLFLLTSHNTFSAGEGFAFILQHLGRAVVVGEPTAGAAHAGRAYPLDCGFEAIIPNTSVVLPGTTTDWETTGVTPDVPVEASRALETARSLAMKKIGATP